MKSQVLLTVWCNVSGEAAGEIWHWSLSGVKGLTHSRERLKFGIIKYCYTLMPFHYCHNILFYGTSNMNFHYQFEPDPQTHYIFFKVAYTTYYVATLCNIVLWTCWSIPIHAYYFLSPTCSASGPKDTYTHGSDIKIEVQSWLICEPLSLSRWKRVILHSCEK